MSSIRGRYVFNLGAFCLIWWGLFVGGILSWGRFDLQSLQLTI